MDFETLKSSSSNFDKLTKALETNLKPEDQSNKNKYQDDRIWKPELDTSGLDVFVENGSEDTVVFELIIGNC